MAEGGRRGHWASLAIWPLAATFALLSGAQPGPVRLYDGSSCELELASAAARSFSVHLAADSVLRLRIEQNGQDVGAEIWTSSGPSLPAIDLPFGSRVREELYFEAARDTDLSLRLVAFEGRGRVRLEAHVGRPASDLERRQARDFAALWRSSELPAARRRASLRRLTTEAADPRQQAMAAGFLGLSKLAELDWAAAVDDFDLALQRLVKDPEPALAAQLAILRSRALVELDRARGQEAYEAARAQALAAADPGGAAMAEQDLALLAWRESDSSETIRRYFRARDDYAAAGFAESAEGQEINLARALTRLGNSPEALGRLLRCLVRLESSPPAATDAAEARRALLLREIGWWLYLEGRAPEARQLIARAVELEPKDTGAWQRLAVAETDLGHFEAARAALKKAFGAGDGRLARAYFETSLTHLELSRGDLAAAKIHGERALELLGDRESPAIRHAVEVLLARCNQLAGDLAAAEGLARSASEAIDQQRLRAGHNRDKLDFLAVRTESAELLTEIRLALHAAAPGAGWDRLALESNEKNRGRLLQDLLAAEGYAETLPLETERRIQELKQILGIRGRGAVLSLLYQGRVAEREAAALSAPLDELDRMRSAAPAPRTAPENRVPPFEIGAVQRELEPGTLLLIFHLGRETAFGWALDRRKLRGCWLGPSPQIRELADPLYEQLAGAAPLRRAAFADWSAQLAAKLYEPFAAELDQARQVVVVVPPELQRIPFAALPYPADSGQPLLASRRLAALPSAAILPELRQRSAGRRPAPRLLAVVDDPVYDGDSRLPAALRRFGPFRRLPDTASEAAALVALAGAGGTRRITSFAANRAQLLGGALAGFRILHFATHARTDDLPRGLILSRYDEKGRPINDVVGFPELASLQLDADLAMTSACSTALGEPIPGEGLLGLSQGFLAAGIPRLVLTLWKVRGEPTRALVDQFYRRLLAGMPPAESLRQAQLALLGQGREVREWGAFELHGDWRPLPDFSPPAVNTSSPPVSLKAGGDRPPTTNHQERSRN